MSKRIIELGNDSDIDGKLDLINKINLKNEQKKQSRKTELHELNEQMKYFKSLKIEVPKVGWLKFIRTKLNIPLQFIADELKIKKQSVADYEENEIKRKISLDKLDRYAQKLGFRLVYYFEPVQNTPLEFVRKQIEESVKRMPEKERVKYSYNPKQEGASARRKEAYIRKILENIPKSLYKSSNKI